ncbi:pantetheine-phosphate adenylyltransferase [Candidatus Gottesmanbacteria bacterium]|nr:pantetheine-phosphate adenylyltransferase [Candidatus Gottesmanbacteria bacterium]
MQNKMHFKVIAIAGTFDRLHKGHKYFIKQAFSYGERVIIGLTSDKFVKAKISNFKFQISNKIQIQNFKTRKNGLEEYLMQNGLLDRSEIVKIDDVYGSAITNNQIEALVVTAETWEGAEKVNKRREELKLSPLKIISVPLIMAEDKKRIASTRIRLGEIDRWGKLYISKIKNPWPRPAQGGQKSKISEELRQELKKPLGELIQGNPNDLHEIAEQLKETVGKTNFTMIITVGDEVTKLCNEVGITINLVIIDYRVNRADKYTKLSELGFDDKKIDFEVQNPPGSISTELIDAIATAYKEIIQSDKPKIIKVSGEEDLAGVPAILLAPLGSIVLYGQPGEGVVAVEVTEEKKEEMIELINRY